MCLDFFFSPPPDMDFKCVLPSPLKDFLLSEALLYTFHSDEEKPISPLKDLHFQSFLKGLECLLGEKKKKNDGMSAVFHHSSTSPVIENGTCISYSNVDSGIDDSEWSMLSSRTKTSPARLTASPSPQGEKEKEIEKKAVFWTASPFFVHFLNFFCDYLFSNCPFG